MRRDPVAGCSDGVGAEISEVDPFESLGMSALEDDLWWHAGLEGLDPSACAQTPAVAGIEARKSILGAWGAEIVPLFGREFEERGRDYGAHDVEPTVLRVHLATPGAREARRRVGTA